MTAADKLRSLAQAAQPGPWHRTGDPVVGGHWVVQADRDSTVCAVTAHYEQSVKDADYIAAMSPDVALALADLIDVSRTVLDIASVSYEGDPWYAVNAGIVEDYDDGYALLERANAALTRVEEMLK